MSRTKSIDKVRYSFDFLQLGVLDVIVGKDGINRACQGKKNYIFVTGRTDV